MQNQPARQILKLRPEGLYCEAGDFFIDPLRAVDRAVITHGHADHARRGHRAVLATQPTIDVMRVRYGASFAGSAQAMPYGNVVTIADARVSLHPAGHVLGSAQVLVEVAGQRIVVSGDYKRSPDLSNTPFEPVRCDIFITEATFGLPVFVHPPAEHETIRLLDSMRFFEGRIHHVAAYSLGKAQRLLTLLRTQGFNEPVFVDRATMALCEVYEHHGIRLGALKRLEAGRLPEGALVIAPPSARDRIEGKSDQAPMTSFASGWMNVMKRARQGGGDLPLVISDHADWPELTRTISEVAPSEVWITHGEEAALLAWARGRGVEARPLSMVGYGAEDDGPEA
jgi:putative mRNA 3-end processing factor